MRGGKGVWRMVLFLQICLFVLEETLHSRARENPLRSMFHEEGTMTQMIITCQECGKTYKLDPERLARKPRFRFKCAQCSHVIDVDILSPSQEQGTAGASSDAEPGLFGVDLFEEIRAHFDTLYPMPHVMLKARAIISDPNADFSKISNIIKADQALASRILKVTNSAYYGLPQKVSTIENASVLLGTKKIIQIINLLSHSKTLKGEMTGYGIDSGTAWRHSLTVAVGSDIISKQIAPDYSGEAFLCGLLHDAGKVLLDPYLSEKQEAFQELMAQPESSIIEVEEKLLGLNHGKIGGELCRQWNMPDFVSDAVTHHHAPAEVPENLLANVVHSTDILAHALHLESLEASVDSLDSNGLLLGHFEREELLEMAEQIQDAVEELEEDTY